VEQQLVELGVLTAERRERVQPLLERLAGLRENVTASRRSRSCRLPSANIASYSACLESKYTYSEGCRIPTARARPCSDTPAIPSSWASVQAHATIPAIFSSRRFATESAMASRSDRRRPV
jgi:hypothetical protein